MTVRFGNNRLAFYIAAIVLSGTVLGLAANFANIFLPIHKDFIIFSLVVSSLTILSFLISLQWAQPRTEAVLLFVLGVLWLTAGAWATDIIGSTQCDGLGGQTIPAKNGGTTDYKSYCYKMKVVQAFSWALFCIFTIALIVLSQLVSLAQRFGRYRIWSEPIRELPWFGEAPGYYNTHGGASSPYPPTPMSPAGYGGYPGYPVSAGMPQPGQSIVIQPGINGAPATVTTIPMTA